MVPPVAVRPYTPADTPALRDVCVRTGWAGQDATAAFRHPHLLHRVYLDPYLEHSPDLALVADDGVAAGYVVAVADTAAYEAWCDEHWWPRLRAEVADAVGGDGPTGVPPEPEPDDPGAWLVRLPFDPPRARRDVLAGHPAHLHVDLLPRLQGAGHGTRLLEALFAALREHGVPGVHLGAAAENQRAVGFYRHLGFRELAHGPGEVLLGLDLT